MSLFPNSETTVRRVAPQPHKVARAAPRRSPRRLHEHHVLAIALACFYFAVFLRMQTNGQFVGLTPIERDVAGLEGWPLIMSDGNRTYSLEPIFFNGVVGGFLALTVGLAINRLGRQRWRLSMRQALILFSVCSLPLAYFSAPWQTIGVHRPPETLHATEMTFLGIGLVCACYELPSLVAEYRRRLLMNRDG